MATGKRREASITPARVMIWAANTALLICTVYLLLRPAEQATVEAAGPAQAAEPSGEELAPAAQSRPRAVPHQANEIRALRNQVEARVQAALRCVEQSSRGKVAASAVVVALHVAEVGGARDLLERSADLALRPASNLKLVTSAAALVNLGIEWQFETAFEARGSIAHGELAGDLIVRAGADPLLAADDSGAAELWLDRLYEELSASGIARVNGALVLDEDPFLDPAPGPAWPSKDQHWADYCALAGAFSVNGGCLTAVVQPMQLGTAARIAVEPRDHGLETRYQVSSVAKREKLTIAVAARGNGVTVQGKIPGDVPRWCARFAHPDPVALFAEVVVGGLARRGLWIAAGWRRERSALGGAIVARLRSPMAATLGPILRDSNNAIADQLFFANAVATTGAGTRKAGQTATAQALRSLSVAPDGLVQVDGSGLSRDNRVTARQLTALVEAVLARGGEGARQFREALPIAGETGSLEERMRNSPARGKIRAKTGWIAGTSSLSGLVEPDGAPALVFSILISYPDAGGLNSSCFKPLQDEICELLLAFAEKNG